jgi:hypothetical protein
LSFRVLIGTSQKESTMQSAVDQRSPRRDLALAVIAFLVALALLQMQGLTFLTYPFRLFVTMIHELGHGLAAILTGGDFLRFEVTQYGAGRAYTAGGSRFAIIQSGYLGTALFGAALLLLTHRTRQLGRIAMGLGVLLAVLTLLYSGISVSSLSLIQLVAVSVVIIVALYLILTRESDQGRLGGLGVALLAGVMLLAFSSWNSTLTVAVGVGSGLALFALGMKATRDVMAVTLTFLAFLTGLQAITDAWMLLKIVSLPEGMMPLNDATSMSQAYGGPAALWALYWMALDVIVFGGAVYLTVIRPARRASKPGG